MSYAPLDDGSDLLKHKGWLKKQSPSAFKAWQDRYFMILNNGHQLAYFEDDKPKSKLKGAIELLDIEKIEQKEKKIEILFSGRDFKLKAPSKQEAAKWVSVIEQLMRKVKSETSSLMTSSTNSNSGKEKQVKKQWKHIDSESYQNIQLEKELSSVQEESKISIEDQNLLMERIGLKEYIKNMNQDFVNNRLCYGFLGKRSQGKVKYFQRRWFVLISAKTLYPSKYNDELILDESKIPPVFEMDTIYYYTPEEYSQMSAPKSSIKMLECQEVIIKDMIKSKESGYTFKINIGDRLYHLMADTEIDRQKWVQAVKSSQTTSREMCNSLKIRVTKNIDPICALYDSTKNLDGRRDKVRAKINEDMAALKKQVLGHKDYLDDYQSLIKFLEPLSTELLLILNCCLVKDPKRIDIVREYIDYLHEKICDIVTAFWDKQYNTLASVNLLQLAYWLHSYCEKMKEFCNDDRIQQGVRVLLNIYINRSIESVEQYVGEIIEYEKKNDPYENENDQLVTQAPVDLFKIINEGYDLAYGMCPIKETACKIAFFARILIRQYQEGLDFMMEEEGLSIERLIAFCNNTIHLNTYSKQFMQRLTNQGGLTEEEADKILDLAKLQKKFVNISSAAKDMFFYHFFSKTAMCFRKPYLEVNLDEVIKEIMAPAQDPIQKLHDSFARKIWKQLLDVIVFYYFNSFIIGCNKAKPTDLPKYKKKLGEDKETLLGEFDGFIFENLLIQGVSPFDSMTEFMDSSSLGILAPCKSLRVYFGKAFTARTVKTLLNIRSDISKEEKKDTLEACGSLIDDYNKQNKEQVSEIEKLKLDSNFGIDEEDEQAVNLEEQLNQSQDQSRRMDLTLDDDDMMAPSLDQQELSDDVKPKQQKDDHIDEGFLHKKKPKEKDFFNSLMVNPMKQMVKLVEKNAINLIDLGNQLDWDYRYFRIRNGFIWLYQNERSRESVGKLDLTKIEDIVAHPVKQLIFTVIMEGGKKHKMKAELKDIRDLWVKSIGKEINAILNAQQEKIEAIKTGEGKKPIIKDYEEIERRERNKHKMEEKKQKLRQRQDEIHRKKEEKRQETSLKKQLSMMPNMKNNHGYDLGDDKRASTIFSIEGGDPFPQQKKLSCWQQCMVCLGVEKNP